MVILLHVEQDFWHTEEQCHWYSVTLGWVAGSSGGVPSVLHIFPIDWTLTGLHSLNHLEVTRMKPDCSKAYKGVVLVGSCNSASEDSRVWRNGTKFPTVPMALWHFQASPISFPFTITKIPPHYMEYTEGSLWDEFSEFFFSFHELSP